MNVESPPIDAIITFGRSGLVYITSPTGVLALRANLSVAYACETESLALAKATELSIYMASMVTEAKTVPADDMEIPELEPPRASAKSRKSRRSASMTPPRP